MSADARRPQDSSRPDRPDEMTRLEELLADRAMQGLSVEEERELGQLLAQAGGLDDDSFDRAAAAMDLALGEQRFEPMPAGLRQRIGAGTAMHSSQIRSARHTAIAESARGVRRPPESAPRSSFVAWSGWIAAAAAIAVTIFLARPAPVTPSPGAAKIVELLEHAKDRTSAAWRPTDDPLSKKVQGDLVWSNALQKGYMRFSGLAKNDPSKAQYQLWIFDKNQDDKHPIDGGVFDVDADTGQVVVPIDAKIHVVSPTMFAVTVEKPGGVVVSAREHIVALAQL